MCSLTVPHHNNGPPSLHLLVTVFSFCYDLSPPLFSFVYLGHYQYRLAFSVVAKK